MTYLLSALRCITYAIILFVAFTNLMKFTFNLSFLPPRAQDPLVVWEDRLRGVRDTLLKAHYLRGDVGYIRASTLSGHEITSDDDANWGEARYGMIPWNLLRHTMDAPYVVADFSGTSAPAQLPASFSTLYESPDGLFVLQRNP